tara:strand:- start:117 stop:584 length:468 start_codon:yes stop_codon:yes gene_type:complete
MNFADFNPSILFLLLWGLLSWFTKKKKKETQKKETIGLDKIPEKEDIFTRLQKLQDHLADKVDILPLKPEEYYWEEQQHDEVEDSEPVFESEITEILPEQEEGFWDGTTSIQTENLQKSTNQPNWLSTSLMEKNNIKKAIILKEILGEPRSLNPY